MRSWLILSTLGFLRLTALTAYTKVTFSGWLCNTPATALRSAEKTNTRLTTISPVTVSLAMDTSPCCPLPRLSWNSYWLIIFLSCTFLDLATDVMTTAPSGARELRLCVKERSSEELVRQWDVDDDEDAMPGVLKSGSWN